MMDQRAWIRAIPPEKATDRLREVYDYFAGPGGSIANILQVQSLDPEALYAHMILYRRLMFGQSPLTRTQREAIAVTVSAVNRCHY